MKKVQEMIDKNAPGVWLSFEEYEEILRGIPVFTIIDLNFLPNRVGVPVSSTILGKQMIPLYGDVYIWNYCGWCGTSVGPVRGRCSNCGGWI